MADPRPAILSVFHIVGLRKIQIRIDTRLSSLKRVYGSNHRTISDYNLLATPKSDKKYKLLLGLPCVYSVILLIVMMLKLILGKAGVCAHFKISAT